MNSDRRSVVARVQKYGLRVICARCASQQRHFPADGRLRDAACKICHSVSLRTEAWAVKNDARWDELVKRTAALSAPFARH